MLGPGSNYRVPASKDIQIYFRSINGTYEAASAIRVSDNLVEHLPHQQFVVNGGDPFALSRGIVVGRVTDVSPGQAFVGDEEQPEGSDSRLVDFDDPDAQWRVARLEIRVDRWFADGSAPETIEVGAFVAHPGSDPLGRAEMRGLAELGRVIVVLDPEREYDWDADVRTVAWGGALLGDIDASGEIGFPGLGRESGRFVGATTLADLEEAWAADPEPIEITFDDETGVRRRE